MKAQVATTVSPESEMLLKTIGALPRACGREPRWEPHGRTPTRASTDLKGRSLTAGLPPGPDARAMRADVQKSACCLPHRTHESGRSPCPCHSTFELLHELRDELTLLAETDPDKKVRGAAWHTLREAIELNVAEEAQLSRDRDREVRRADRDRKRAVRGHVALRLARRRA